MRHLNQSSLLRLRIVLLSVVGLSFWPVTSKAQDSSEQGTKSRGDRAEIAVTVRDGSGEILTSPVSVKLYQNGIPTDQASTSHGRVFFIPRTLGDFTITVEAAGYKTAEKSVSIIVAVKDEVDFYLKPDVPSNQNGEVPGKPLLAPKAQAALDQGLQAIKENDLDRAQKYMSEAMRLAPGNPEVLYVQGALYMRRGEWLQADTVLEKSNQFNPNRPQVLGALGITLCHLKKYEQAIPPLEKSIQSSPTAGWETEWALAKSYYYREQYGQAVKMAQQARADTQEPTPQVELLLAQCLTAVGRYEDSAQVLREFLKNNATAPEAETARHWLDGLIADGKVHAEANPIR